MELLKELLIVLFRVITILPIFLFITLMMGRRSIAEVPVFDFLILVTLAAVVGADLADPKISHIHTGFAILAVGIFQIIVSKLMLSNRKFGRLISFEPSIVIQNGKLLIDNMKKIRFSIDDIFEMLRDKDVFDLQDVELGIVEKNGKLSVIKKAQKMNPTFDDLGLVSKNGGLAYPVIVEGKVYDEVLSLLNVNRAWLQQQLTKQGVHNINHVFFASVNQKLEFHISTNDHRTKTGPPLYH